MSTIFGSQGSLRAFPLTLYTELLVVRGTIPTLQHRITDILNQAAEPHLVLEDVTLEEYGSTEPPLRAAFAQVNLASVLFAVSLTTLAPVHELRTPKVSERALLSIPPFRVVGQVHLLLGRSLRESLADLSGTFIPVTDATFWSDRAGEARQTVAFVGVNRARAQVFAPFHEVDQWSSVGLAEGEPGPPEPEPEPPAAG
jgi:hypothetical protein